MRAAQVTGLVLIALLCCACPKNRPPVVTQPPVATPTPTPDATPSPEATPATTPLPSPLPSPSPLPGPAAWPTPYPTPDINPAGYIPPPRTGSIVRLRGEDGEDYAAKIQAVMDNAADVALVELGPGSLKRSIILRIHTRIATTPAAPLACDQTEGIDPWRNSIPHSDYGCMLVADGVHVSGNFTPPQEMADYFTYGDIHFGYRDPWFVKLAALTDDTIAGDASTVLEPSFSLGPQNPGIIVFQALGDILGQPHRGISRDIAITGIVVQGRQKTHYDGGVRAAVALGNCHHCTAQNNFLRDTGSIGLQAGGVADEGNFSNGVVFTGNINSGGAAAHIAAVNGDNIYGFHNYSRRPGRVGWGGGVSAFDMETNSAGDHSNNVWMNNNLADYEGASLGGGAGSAFLAQDPYRGSNRGKVFMVNNAAIGGRGDTTFRYMSNGLYAVGLTGCQISNNYVFRTGQNGLQMYNSEDCTIQDNDFEHTGGGGAATVQFSNVQNTTIRRSNWRSTPGLTISAEAGFREMDGSCGNTFEANSINGERFEQASAVCPARVLGPPVQRKFISGSSWRGFTGIPMRSP